MTMKPGGKPAYLAARHIEQTRDDISLADALALTTLVLEHDGGPVPLRGKRAFTDEKTAKRLVVLELAELREDWGRPAGTSTRTAWVLSASEAGTDLVQGSLDHLR